MSEQHLIAAPQPTDRSQRAVPVAVELADPDLAHQVARHVEHVLGWQVVHDGPALPARVVIADAVGDERPTVVVARDVDADALRRSLHAGALDHLAWPADADRLATLTLPTAAARIDAGQVIGISGAAAGVGASCVALLLAGALAWRGWDTVLLGGVGPHRLAGLVPGEALQGVAGVERLRLGPASLPPAQVGTVDAMVLDLGVVDGGHVLVAHPDGALVDVLRAAPEDRWPVVVLMGEGGLHGREIATMVRGRMLLTIPTSFRLSRAALEGRLPVGAPGWAVRHAEQIADALTPGGQATSGRRWPWRAAA